MYLLTVAKHGNGELYLGVNSSEVLLEVLLIPGKCLKQAEKP